MSKTTNVLAPNISTKSKVNSLRKNKDPNCKIKTLGEKLW